MYVPLKPKPSSCRTVASVLLIYGIPDPINKRFGNSLEQKDVVIKR